MSSISTDLRGKKVQVIETSGGTMRVLSRKDLIAMKRASGRPQDLADIAALEKLRMRPVQHFTPRVLEQCRQMTPDQIIRFVEDFRRLHGGRQSGVGRAKSRLISLKVPEDLLEAFKARARLSGRPYQTQIKELMKAWVTARGGESGDRGA